MSATAGATATGLVTTVLLVEVPLFCTVLIITGLVTKGVGMSPTAATVGYVTTAAATTLGDPTFVSALLRLELIATGPLAPAVTDPGGPTVIGLAVTALLSPPPDEPALLLLSLPPPPQAVIKIGSKTAMIADGLQIL